MKPHPVFFAPRRRAALARGFTLVEMLVVSTIVLALAGMVSPVIGALIRDVRLTGAMARIRAGFLQTHLVLLDQMRAPVPQIAAPAKVDPFLGVAMVFRWAPAKGTYDIFYASHAAGAMDNHSPANTLSSLGKVGYARMDLLEPMTLGTGVMVAGVRTNAANPNGLELVSNSFAVCIGANQQAIPPAQKVYVNIQETPSGNMVGPWGAWDTGDYDPVRYDEASGAGGEGFSTALPMVIVYRDDDLPHDEGGAKVYRNADGTLNTTLDPDELLRVTRGRLEMLTIQGGNTLEF